MAHNREDLGSIPISTTILIGTKTMCELGKYEATTRHRHTGEMLTIVVYAHGVEKAFNKIREKYPYRVIVRVKRV